MDSKAMLRPLDPQRGFCHHHQNMTPQLESISSAVRQTSLEAPPQSPQCSVNLAWLNYIYSRSALKYSPV